MARGKCEYEYAELYLKFKTLAHEHKARAEAQAKIERETATHGDFEMLKSILAGMDDEIAAVRAGTEKIKELGA